MNYRLLALAIAALSSAHISAAAAQSVYVAPGGVYIGGGPVYVIPAPSNGNGYGNANGYGYGNAYGYGDGYGNVTYVEPVYGYGVQEPTPYLAPTVVAPGAGYVAAALYGLNRNRYGNGYGYHNGYGNGYGNAYGYRNGYGNGYGNAYGYGPPPRAVVMTTGVGARGVGVRPGTPANRGGPVNRVGRR
jgi:hypothetical protein